MSLRVGDYFIQSMTNSNATGTGSFTTSAFGLPISTGNTIVVAVSDDSGSTNQITGITDSAGNTYTQFPSSSVGSIISACIWYCAGIKGGSSVTLSVTYTSISITNVGIVAQEFKGVLYTGTPTDKVVTASGSSTTPTTAATAITTRNQELVIGATAYSSGGGSATLGAGFANLGNETTNAGQHTAQESKIVGATAAQTAAFTIGVTTTWVCVCATFFASAPSFRSQTIRPHPFSPGLAR